MLRVVKFQSQFQGMAACRASANCPGPGIQLNISDIEGIEVAYFSHFDPNPHLGGAGGPWWRALAHCVQRPGLWGQVGFELFLHEWYDMINEILVENTDNLFLWQGNGSSSWGTFALSWTSLQPGGLAVMWWKIRWRSSIPLEQLGQRRMGTIFNSRNPKHTIQFLQGTPFKSSNPRKTLGHWSDNAGYLDADDDDIDDQ